MRSLLVLLSKGMKILVFSEGRAMIPTWYEAL